MLWWFSVSGRVHCPPPPHRGHRKKERRTKRAIDRRNPAEVSRRWKLTHDSEQQSWDGPARLPAPLARPPATDADNPPRYLTDGAECRMAWTGLRARGSRDMRISASPTERGEEGQGARFQSKRFFPLSFGCPPPPPLRPRKGFMLRTLARA